MQMLIAAAAGNMGSLLARHLLASPHRLRLLVHRTPLPFDASVRPNASVCRADLGDPATLAEPCRDVDCIVHFAGVLFAPRPEKFLPRTNVGYVENLLAAARAAGVHKFVLVSFPRARGSWRRSASSRPVTERAWCPWSCASAPSTAAGCEAFAALFGTAAPLTRDFVAIGMVSTWADTSRMKRELLPRLAYPSLREGLVLL